MKRVMMLTVLVSLGLLAKLSRRRTIRSVCRAEGLPGRLKERACFGSGRCATQEKEPLPMPCMRSLQFHRNLEILHCSYHFQSVK